MNVEGTRIFQSFAELKNGPIDRAGDHKPGIGGFEWSSAASHSEREKPRARVKRHQQEEAFDAKSNTPNDESV